MFNPKAIQTANSQLLVMWLTRWFFYVQEARFSTIQEDYEELSAKQLETQQALQSLQQQHANLQQLCEVQKQELAAAHLELDQTIM